MIPHPAFGPFAAALSSLGWAIGSNTYSKLSETHSPFSVNLTRSLFAAPLFLITAFVMTPSFSELGLSFAAVPLRSWVFFMGSMVVSFGAGDILLYTAARSLGISGALAIASSYPIATWAFQIFRGNQNFRLLQSVGLFLAVFGVIIVILSQAKAGPRLSPKVKTGVVLSFLTAGFWALNTILVSLASPGVSMPIANTIRMTTGIGVTYLMGRIFFPKKPVFLPRSEIKKFFPVFIGEAYLGSMCYYWGLSLSSLVIGATFSSLAPVFAIPIALITKTEKFSIKRLLGVILVVFGLWMLLGVFK